MFPLFTNPAPAPTRPIDDFVRKSLRLIGLALIINDLSVKNKRLYNLQLTECKVKYFLDNSGKTEDGS